MPPFLPGLVRRNSVFQPSEASHDVSKQWAHPGDVFSVLLILGGDIVARALAQLSGRKIGSPSFSFGWVAYSMIALLSALGENRLMPPPDCSCLVINGSTGYTRNNTSWILGRMIRDYDSWMDKSIREKVESMIESNWTKHKKDTLAKKELEPPRPTRVGLCIAIYEPDLAGKIGEPEDKVLYALSIVVAVIQLGVATIPCGIFGDWGILLVTACGILLSLATASLPQWQLEKWACRSLRKGSNKKVVLTKGNGSQHAIVVIGVGGFLDLEDLATGQTNLDVSTSTATRIAVIALAILWISLLVTASGLTKNTWFLLSVGGIGIVFNIYVAGRSSDPRSVGIPLKFKAVIASPKVMQALYDIEEAYPKLGRSMLETFFPGRLRDDEKKAWDMYDQKASLNEAEKGDQRDGQQVVSSTPES